MSTSKAGGQYIQHLIESDEGEVREDSYVTTLVHPGGTVDLLFDAGKKLSVELDASPWCRCSALMWDGYISVRYGREIDPEESPVAVTSFHDREEIGLSARMSVPLDVAERLRSGVEPEHIFVACRETTLAGFEIVNENEIERDTFDLGGMVVEAKSEAEAIRLFTSYVEWSSQRYFSIFESRVTLSGEIVDTEQIVDSVRADKTGWYLL